MIPFVFWIDFWLGCFRLAAYPKDPSADLNEDIRRAQREIAELVR